jgi:hypothetical protein
MSTDREPTIRELLERLTERFTEFSGHEKRLQRCMLEKNWRELELILTGLERAASEITALEEARVRELERLRTEAGLPEDASFYEIIGRFPEPERSACSAAYRALKTEVYITKGVAENIGRYASSATGSLREMLDELYPHRRGKLYTKDGFTKSSRMDALVVNQRL